MNQTQPFGCHLLGMLSLSCIQWFQIGVPYIMEWFGIESSPVNRGSCANTIDTGTSCITYPFTPFFVIFENIVHHTCWTPAVEQDLQLLSATMTYYSEMRSQMRLLATVCARQQRVAAIFLRLAQIHDRQYASVQVANDMETSTESRRLSQAGCYCGSAYSDREVDGFLPPLKPRIAGLSLASMWRSQTSLLT